MTRLKDKTRTVEIEMKLWQGNGYSPDFSADFFEVGSLEYDANEDAYMVDDCEYCVEQAEDWKHGTGDYAMYELDENSEVFVTWL